MKSTFLATMLLSSIIVAGSSSSIFAQWDLSHYGGEGADARSARRACWIEANLGFNQGPRSAAENDRIKACVDRKLRSAKPAPKPVRIDPRCSGMQDKFGCSCALQNGGKIETGAEAKYKWTYPNSRAADFKACNDRAARN
jgi:hypothetical protein